MAEDLAWLAPLTPLVIPVVGALATVLTARLGIGGHLRRLDLLKARLALTESLLTAVKDDPALTQRLQYQINDIAADLITQHGTPSDLADDDLEALRKDPDLPRRWGDYGWLRRRLLLPFPSGFVGKAMALFYYYLLVVSVLGVAVILQEPPAEQAELVLSLLLIWGCTYGFGRVVKRAYQSGYQTAVERRLVRMHLQPRS
ncbi:MAG: hypothetical protein OIF47_10835 [Marinibacterium sp.]|nr:hypothetical protein [Marinibacterium sp.]